jgi:hypothetical protein
MRYIAVTGGVVSGLGKGITISSIGRLLKQSGLRVTSIKIDPYLNVDAGTMSPFEHGEVFVLNDGGEVGPFLLVDHEYGLLLSRARADPSWRPAVGVGGLTSTLALPSLHSRWIWTSGITSASRT